ncbi:MAG: peptidase T, partial [Candidatus Krumholzibacteriota bacterium]|nr:peptidase T [Candidatus Krumholzibacteriota bacterium]
LHEELVGLGVADASIDENGYVFGTIPSTLSPGETESVPVVGFIAHADTVPTVSGDGVEPVVHANYQGGDIVLPGDHTQVIHASEYPNLEGRYVGMDIVTSNGTTLLGADDKAGVAEVMTAVDLFMQNPDIRHGTIKVGFTPDEEIGRGANLFDVERFGAQFAYTMDGGPLGEIEYETFNAYSANITIEGVSAHPGYAKDKLVNALRIAAEFLTLLPADLSPERTDGREGYIHPYVMNGKSESVLIKMILRDFDMAGIEKQKEIIDGIVAGIAEKNPDASIKASYRESYRNMRYVIDEEPRLVEYADEAVRRVGVEPHHELIRGGTDGARLSYMGLPCPNLFAGGEAIHSEREWVPVQVMEKAAETIIRLSEIWAEKSLGK